MQSSREPNPNHLDVVRATLDRLRGELLDERTGTGHWEGELSASALSTATAISALSVMRREIACSPEVDTGGVDMRSLDEAIDRGMMYLCRSQNADGGFGDTDRSHSNIATSYLALAAATLSPQADGRAMPAPQQQQLSDYIQQAGGLAALRARYGKDKTFVVPILTNCAIAGLVHWKQVSPLPFEAAVFPQSMYRLLRMPVVSYAIPALVAIGQVRHFLGPRSWFPVRMIRSASVRRTMKVLRRMQPESGGYLEATPLTSFVVMSLAASGRAAHPVTRHGVRFLIESMREDGSWPIDTNLATWVTSLAMHALSCDPQDDGIWATGSLLQWHLECQHRERHPFTGASPGGWGWTDLSGAVPDSDDTPAAILALRCAQRHFDDEALQMRCDEAIDRGVRWLADLQNRDGGWPTFCRGWGKLPFDRSSNDLTAHALRAIDAAGDVAVSSGGVSEGSRRSASKTGSWISPRAWRAGAGFLQANQQADGSWLPLWFGNQDREQEDNPVYGTAKVLATAGLGVLSQDALQRGVGYLVAHQNADGGWGGGESVSRWLRRSANDSGQQGHSDPAAPAPPAARLSSIEETALAVDALCTVRLAERQRDGTPPHLLERNLEPRDGVKSEQNLREVGGIQAKRPRNPVVGPDSRFEKGESTGGGKDACEQAIIRGVEFLLGSVEADRHRLAWPIGFYFAKLWYHERLYPLIFTIAALGKYINLVSHHADPTPRRSTVVQQTH